MERYEVANKVIETIINRIGIQSEDIVEKSNFHNDLGFDSLDDIELIMDLENEYDISIPDEDWKSVETVGELIDVVTRLVIV